MSFVKLPVLSNGLTVRHEDICSDAAMSRRIEILRNLMKKMNVAALVIYTDGAVGGAVCYLTNYPCYRQGRRGAAVLGLGDGPFLYTSDPSRNVPAVRRFTSCDLEGSKKFLSLGCKQALRLAGNGAIGLVGGELLSMKLSEELEKEFAGKQVSNLSEEYYRTITTKDESSFSATLGAARLARQGLDIMKEQAASGKDLWQMASYLEYRLRLLGCESTNILLNCAARGKLRPAYPGRTKPVSGDVVISYIAVRFARHWAVAGGSMPFGLNNKGHADNRGKLREVLNNVTIEIRPEMSLDRIEAAIRAEGMRSGLSFADDIPIVSGIGFDLSEYPIEAKDRVADNTVLQLILALDPPEGGATAMAVEMLKVTDAGAVCLSNSNVV